MYPIPAFCGAREFPEAPAAAGYFLKGPDPAGVYEAEAPKKKGLRLSQSPRAISSFSLPSADHETLLVIIVILFFIIVFIGVIAF